MALIIKGEIPSCCAVCCDCNPANDGNFCNRTGNRLRNDWQLYRPSNCPILGEIPDEHGRLVDADKILTESGYDPMMFQPKYGGDHRTQYDTLMGYEILGIIEDAPTVVEATT